MRKYFAIALFAALFVASCEPSDPQVPPTRVDEDQDSDQSDKTP